MITRRGFLKYTGERIFLISSLSLLNSCSGLKRNDLLRETEESIRHLDRDEIEILRLASLAPSGHNTQPWTVKIVEPKRWIIGSDKRRWLPAVDPENRELLLSIGALLKTW